MIVAGSPRRGGNSDTMAETARSVFELAGIAAEIVYLRDLGFTPCLACSACYADGRCRQADGLVDVYTKLVAIEMIVFAAPVYFQSLGALAKGFVDRMQCFWATKYVLKQKIIPDPAFRRRRRTYALLCGGTDYPDTFTCAEKIIRLFGSTVEAKYAGGTFFTGIDALGDLQKDEENLVRIREAIQAFIQLGR